MFKKYNYFQNFPAFNFAIAYGAIIFTAAVCHEKGWWFGVHNKQ